MLRPRVEQVPSASLHHHGKTQRGKSMGYRGGAPSQTGAERVEMMMIQSQRHSGVAEIG
jgi:hypothetical protein